MTIKELRTASKLSRHQFAEYFNIPYRTLQNWELGTRECPQYLLDLMEYKLRNEKLIK
jgi:DNA-binding transcriptional regulator YiaG